jgi:hypothetical protein
MPNELLRLRGYMLAQKLHKQHKNPYSSKRSVKGRAKGYHLPLKGFNVTGTSPSKLFYSPHKYKSLNSTFNGITQAS